MTGGADLTAAPTATEHIVIDGICVTAAAAMALSLLEETSGTVMGILNIGAGSGVQFDFRNFGGIKLPTADKKLRGDADGAGQVDVFCFYHSEACDERGPWRFNPCITVLWLRTSWGLPPVIRTLAK